MSANESWVYYLHGCFLNGVLALKPEHHETYFFEKLQFGMLGLNAKFLDILTNSQTIKTIKLPC